MSTLGCGSVFLTHHTLAEGLQASILIPLGQESQEDSADLGDWDRCAFHSANLY